MDGRQVLPGLTMSIDDALKSIRAFSFEPFRQSLDAANDVVAVLDSRFVMFSLATNDAKTMFQAIQPPSSIALVMLAFGFLAVEFPSIHCKCGTNTRKNYEKLYKIVMIFPNLLLRRNCST